MAEYNQDKKKIVEFLASLPKDEATRIICLLALGAVSAVHKDYSQWESVERTVFNAAVLFFCDEKLKNADLVEMINSGIQIEDLRNFTNDPVPFARIAEDVASRAMGLLSAIS